MDIRKKFFITLAVVTFLTILTITQGASVKGLNFKAPAINGKDNVYAPEVGEIIYDSSDASFYGRTQNNQWVSFNAGNSPVGAITMWAVNTIPTGYLECNGQAVSRTDYSQLFAILGTTYGAGDGSTTFNLPDFRGQFLRGRDNGAGIDPDASTRTDRGDGTSGDNVGTKQGSAVKSHTHYADGGAYLKGSGGGTYWQKVAINGQWTVYYNSRTGFTGGAESRPANISTIFIIKAN